MLMSGLENTHSPTYHQFLSAFPVYNHEFYCVCNILRETNGMISKSPQLNA